ncbi:hypothetical protein Ahy_A04g019472 [Arachis hypogaea]|uniref:Uncharacterized protein n=1 Tax=Arachis hypogaea TaxID=3818 RepID=A0A445DG66_ARAHY|nr:hypothetical protein Ahy_A04g019472 [Arachis hypogaea]
MLREDREKRRRSGKGGRSRVGAAEFAAAVALPCQLRRERETASAHRETSAVVVLIAGLHRRVLPPPPLLSLPSSPLKPKRESVFVKRGRARAHEGEERRKGKEKQKTMNPGEKEEVCSHTVLLCRRGCRRLGSRPSPSHLVPVAIREYYGSGETKKGSWRESQLKGLRRFLIEKEEDILKALMLD